MRQHQADDADHYTSDIANYPHHDKKIFPSQEPGQTARDGDRLHGSLTLQGPRGAHDLSWTFDSVLRRYVITLSDIAWLGEDGFGACLRHRKEKKRRTVQTFIQVLVPTPDEDPDLNVIHQLRDVLKRTSPRPALEAGELWFNPLHTLAQGEMEQLSRHQATANLTLGSRHQGLSLHAYQGCVHILSTIAQVHELGHRDKWGGAPTAEGVGNWALDTTNALGLGYLDVSEQEALVFGIRLVHGALSEDTRKQLLEYVARRADAWEATLTGEDRY